MLSFAAVAFLAGMVSPAALPIADTLPIVVPNDNRVAAGRIVNGVLRVHLEARAARWKPDATVDSFVTVQTFGEVGKTASIPGPLIRVQAGTPIELTLTNRFTDSTLFIRGIALGSAQDSLIVLRPGASRRVRFVPPLPGTYLYWGSRQGQKFGDRWGRDAQLSGVIIVDPRGVEPDTAERIFVLTVVDIYADSTRPPTTEDIWEATINGRSWPFTERLHYTVGDSVRWRVINASERRHPMHLHGFHFRVTARGDGMTDTLYSPEQERLAVTELLPPGASARIVWQPTRPGAWLFHCHMAFHMSPFPERPDSVRHHEHGDISRHPMNAMAGLVLGIEVAERNGADTVTRSGAPASDLRVLVTESRSDHRVQRGYAIESGSAAPTSSPMLPSPALILHQGETSRITVVNRLADQATSIHWHGMELQSLYDGVSGWSGTAAARAPLIAPGDSFAVEITPPRAGTFIYHTHMDEEDQLRTGLYGAMIVLPAEEEFDPATDLIMLLGLVPQDSTSKEGLNGAVLPPARQLKLGASYRLRLINILPNATARFSVVRDDAEQQLFPVAQDGADLPPYYQQRAVTGVSLGVGETYDLRWEPVRAGEYALRAVIDGEGPGTTIQQRLMVAAVD